MPRSFATIACVLIAGCDAAPRPGVSPDAATATPEQPMLTREDSLSERLQRFVPALAPAVSPIAAHLDEMERALRADSGTLHTDTVFLRDRLSLDSLVRSAARTFDSDSFQILVWSARGRGERMSGWTARGRRLESYDAATADSLVDFLDVHGIWSYMAEGSTYFVVSEPYLQRRFGRFVTDAMREWLVITGREQVRPTGGDASLMIPVDELMARWAETDRYLTGHPNAVAADHVRVYHLGYMRAYLSGWDNARVFQRSTRMLLPERRESFERYVSRYPGTNNAAIVSEYLEVLAAGDYRRTAAVVAFLRRYLDHIADAR